MVSYRGWGVTHAFLYRLESTLTPPTFPVVLPRSGVLEGVLRVTMTRKTTLWLGAFGGDSPKPIKVFYSTPWGAGLSWQELQGDMLCTAKFVAVGDTRRQQYQEDMCRQSESCTN